MLLYLYYSIKMNRFVITCHKGCNMAVYRFVDQDRYNFIFTAESQPWVHSDRVCWQFLVECHPWLHHVPSIQLQVEVRVQAILSLVLEIFIQTGNLVSSSVDQSVPLTSQIALELCCLIRKVAPHFMGVSLDTNCLL